MRKRAVPIIALGVFLQVVPGLSLPPVGKAASTPVPVPEEAVRALRQITYVSPSVGSAPEAPQQPAQTPHAAPAPQPPHSYVVRSGDNLWAIAQRHNVSVEGLASANGLRLTSILQPGMKLTVPAAGEPARPVPEPAGPAPAAQPRKPRATAAHTVRPGETLWSISRAYGTTVEDLMALNELGDSDWIKPGQRLVISARTLPRHRQVAQQRAQRDAQADAALAQALGPLTWPSRGSLTSRFGWRYRRHHDGIDLAAPRGTPIYAARDGVVDFAGWKPGYGRVVYIDHGNGVVTVYGHASKLLVRTGQQVKQGQVIALVGCTGICTGSHLHFEVRAGGRAVNPLRFLR